MKVFRYITALLFGAILGASVWGMWLDRNVQSTQVQLTDALANLHNAQAELAYSRTEATECCEGEIHWEVEEHFCEASLAVYRADCQCPWEVVDNETLKEWGTEMCVCDAE